MSTETEPNTDTRTDAPVAENSTFPEVRRDATVMELAMVVADSRDFPDCRTPEKAAVRILAGREMGVGPIASVIGIRVQAGRVSMDATLMAGCIKRSGRYDYKVSEHTNDACALHFYENGEMVGASTFSREDAKTAGLAGKDTWRAYPRNMLFARALSNGARWYCAGIFGGSIYTHEELGYQVDEEGRAVGGDDDDGGDNGSDLCTREQRQQLTKLLESAGKLMPKFLEETGIRMLDELSQYEALKWIKKLGKRLEKDKQNDGRVTAATDAAPAEAPGPVHEGPVPAGVSPSPAGTGYSPAQQAIKDAFDENTRPTTHHQRDTIIALAEKLEPDPTLCREMLIGILARRNVHKINELTHLQASALIEAMEAKLADCPFDPSPTGARMRGETPTA